MLQALRLRELVATAVATVCLSGSGLAAAPRQTPIGPPTRPTQSPPADTSGRVSVTQAPPAAGVADGGLPRRPRVGLMVAETPSGLVVRSVTPRSPAANAGIREGDVIANVNGAPMQTGAAFEARIRTMHAGEMVTITVVRGAEPLEVQVTPEEALREGDFDAKVEYNTFTGSGGRLRSVWAVPSRLPGGRVPAVLVVRGVGAPAADAPGNNPFRDLAFQLARAGIVTIRYDAAGIGDSEGPPNSAVDFTTEVADARAALQHVRNDPRVDPDRVFLLGQGTGGGVASVVTSSDHKVAGLVVIGIIARPVIEYLLDSRRQQLLLAGVPVGDIDDILRQHITIYAQLLENDGVPQPDELGVVAPDGTMMGKRGEFWKQYDQVNFGRLFAELTVPVMNVYGEFDFVSTLADHRAVADALREHSSQVQAIYIFDHTDHDLKSFDSRDAAFAAFGTDAPINERAVSAIADWVRAQVQQRGA